MSNDLLKGVSGTSVSIKKWQEEEKNKVGLVISETIYHPVLEYIYKKNSVVAYLGEFCDLIDNPTVEKLERIKLHSSLIFWDIIFSLMENNCDIYADDTDEFEKRCAQKKEEMTNFQREEFILNFAAANFFIFSHLEIEVINRSPRSAIMLSIVK